MDLSRPYGNLLKSDGTNQWQRLLPALQSGYIVPDERSLADLLDYAGQVAAQIRYFDLTGQATGDWRAFLEALSDPDTGRAYPTPQLEAALAARADWPPHLVLFLVFLKLFGHLQDDFNELTHRHLCHYYEQVLGLQRRRPVADATHVVFQLARNAAPTRLPAGTRLDAGKDDQGRPLVYATQFELVVSHAVVADLRRLVVDRDRRLGHRRFFVANAIAKSEGPSWYTFGCRQSDLEPGRRFMTEAVLGFGLAAPVLRLAEGERTVTLRASLRAMDPRQLRSARLSGEALSVALTGAAGWLTPERVQATLVTDGAGALPVLTLTLSLGPGAAAIVPFDSALHGPGPLCTQPLLRCLIKGESGIYEVLEGLVVERVELEVAVKGVRTLVVQNADGLLNANQPLPPFGSRPQIGAPFCIGSAEVFGKQLSSLILHLEWQAPPADLKAHYGAYFDQPYDQNFSALFRADLDLHSNRTFHPLRSAQPLFAPITTAANTITVPAQAFAAALSSRPDLAQPDQGSPDSFDPAGGHGFLRLVLRGPTQQDLKDYATTIPFEAFGHSAFAPRCAAQALALSLWILDTKLKPHKDALDKGAPAVTPGDGVDTSPKLPNEPYTPVLAGLSLDYRAAAGLIPGDPGAAETFFVYGPFGGTPAGEQVPARLVPTIDGTAGLFLGVANLRPPADLSLLFQIDTGTSGTDADSAGAPVVLQPGETRWSVLSGERWLPLPPAALLRDSTQGFQQTGLVALAVPAAASLDHQALPSGLVWLRALIAKPPASAARTQALQTQAVLAEFQPGDSPLADYATHLASGLAADTIKRLQRPAAAIKGVAQPSPSFGGRGLEGEAAFLQRCSERLRHRRRAVTGWDLERLVLDAFPEVFKVRCLPHTDDTGAAKAGHTTLVIVPNPRRSGGADLLAPRAGEALMAAIRAFLAAGLTSPFATVHVIHPVYERLRVQVWVTFAPGRDPGYYTGVLNDELRRFLSPWAYQEGEDILFEARIDQSEVLAFLEGRDYIDHVVNCNLYQGCAGRRLEEVGAMMIGHDFIIRPRTRPAISQMRIGDDLVVGHWVEMAATTLPYSILASHPQHLITALGAGDDRCVGATRLGIGYLTVGMDFRVTRGAAG